MKRSELMDLLKKRISFFDREYKRWGEETDKTKDLSWLYLDDLAYDPMPVTIPKDYLVGLQASINGKDWETKPRYDCPGRKVNLEVMDFGFYGNQHKYGEVFISGVQWVSGNISSFGSSFEAVENRARSNWKMDIRKIITEADSYAQTDGYNLGEGSERFENLEELYCTAAYVALLRIEGPFVMYLGSTVCVLGKDKIMLKVGRNGAVSLGPVMKRLIN